MSRSFDWLDRELQSRFPIERELDRWSAIKSAPAYRYALVREHGFIAPLEQALELAHLDQLLDLKKRNKAHLVVRDLVALGMKAAESAALPTCLEIPSPSDPPIAIGWMLVIERAALSHDRIFLRLAGSMPREMAFASAFLKCYVGVALVHWRELGTAIQKIAAAPGAMQRVLDGATDAFACHERWIRGE